MQGGLGSAPTGNIALKWGPLLGLRGRALIITLQGKLLGSRVSGILCLSGGSEKRDRKGGPEAKLHFILRDKILTNEGKTSYTLGWNYPPLPF